MLVNAVILKKYLSIHRIETFHRVMRRLNIISFNKPVPDVYRDGRTMTHWLECYVIDDAIEKITNEKTKFNHHLKSNKEFVKVLRQVQKIL